MAQIRSRDTKPELLLRRALFAAGVRGWRCHLRDVPGKPDLAFTRWKVAVFVDGRFWHGHPDYFTPGKSGAYWDAKIERTKERDWQANEALAGAGWRVVRFWDFEIETDPRACARKVENAVAAVRLRRDGLGAASNARISVVAGAYDQCPLGGDTSITPHAGNR